MNEFRVGLDLDQVLADFMGPYLARFGPPKKSNEITKNVQQILSKDRNFWLSLPVINNINFEPELYCSKRVNPKVWSKKWLEINNFPKRPFYQMYYQHGNKATMIKGRVDVFVDDSVSNFIKLNESGVPCLLLDTPYNQEVGPELKIYSLDIQEILYAYNLANSFKIFKEFKKYYNEAK